MAKPWADVVKDTEFLALPAEDRELARVQYFQEVVAPRIDTADIEMARQQFDEDTVTPEVGRLQTAAGEFVKGAGNVVSSIPKAIPALTPAVPVGDPFYRMRRNPTKIGEDAAPSADGLDSLLRPDPREHPAYKAGAAVDDYMAKLVTTNPEYKDEFWAGKVSAGLGSTLGFALTGLLTGPYGMAVAGVASSAVDGLEDALENGASVEEAIRTANFNAPIGMTEAIPLARMFDRIDKGTGGTIKRALINAAKTGTEEAAQEAVQQIAQNVIASDVVQYDPDRKMWVGAGENAGVGATSGGIVAFLGSLVGGRRHRGPRTDKAIADTVMSAPDVDSAIAAADKAVNAPRLSHQDPDPMIAFPDGSVARKSEVDAMMGKMSPEERAKFEEQMVQGRTRELGIGAEDAPKAPPAPETADQVIARSAVPQSKTAADIIAEQTGVNRPEAGKAFKRASDFKAAANEKVGVTVDKETQQERPVTAGEYFARQAAPVRPEPASPAAPSPDALYIDKAQATAAPAVATEQASLPTQAPVAPAPTQPVKSAVAAQSRWPADMEEAKPSTATPPPKVGGVSVSTKVRQSPAKTAEPTVQASPDTAAKIDELNRIIEVSDAKLVGRISPAQRSLHAKRKATAEKQLADLKARPREELATSQATAFPKGSLAPGAILEELTATGSQGIETSSKSKTWNLMAKRLVRDGKAVERDGRIVAKDAATEKETIEQKRARVPDEDRAALAKSLVRYREARFDGKEESAKSIKGEIDSEIKRLNLDPEDVYGKDPEQQFRDVENYRKRKAEAPKPKDGAPASSADKLSGVTPKRGPGTNDITQQTPPKPEGEFTEETLLADVKSAMAEIAAIVSSSDHDAIGLRVIPPEYDGPTSVGSVLDDSYVWEDNNWTDEKLDGVSTIGIRHGYARDKDIANVLNELGVGENTRPRSTYSGDTVVLVGGERGVAGEDIGEVIVSGKPTILGAWKRAEREGMWRPIKPSHPEPSGAQERAPSAVRAVPEDELSTKPEPAAETVASEDALYAERLQKTREKSKSLFSADDREAGEKSAKEYWQNALKKEQSSFDDYAAKKPFAKAKDSQAQKERANGIRTYRVLLSEIDKPIDERSGVAIFDIDSRVEYFVDAKKKQKQQEQGDTKSNETAKATTEAATALAQAAQELKEVAKELKAARQAPPAANIQDFGEKLEGARKDRTYSLDKELTDDALVTEPLSKVWPADEWEGFEDNFIAAVAFTARAEVPAKPRTSYKVARWVERVKTVRSLAQKVADGTITADGLRASLGSRRGLDGFYTKVRLLEALPREHWKRIGSVSEYPDAYGYDADGKKIVQPFSQVEIDGKTSRFPFGSIADALDGINEKLGTAAQDKKMQFEIRGRLGVYFINKKGDKEYRHLKEFTDSKEALAYRDSHYDDLVAAWEDVKNRDNVKETDVRSAENRPRTGADHRKGKDVSVEQFSDTLGFRGGQFGNWISQGAGAKDRQSILNQSYDALMDLADIVGIPPKAISLNGTLGMSFGARGSGAASAHFEPSNLVINLTKTRGAGTLAHEWFHALDNYFSRQRGGEVKFTGDNAAYRQSNYITYRPEPMMVRKDGHGGLVTKAQLKRWRETRPDVATYGEQYWESDPKHQAGVRPEVERAFAELVDALNASPMAARAKSIDKAADGYWSRIIERGARSFENFIISKMMEKGYNNDYLANVTPIKDFKRSNSRYPYLLPEEVAPISEAFDTLFATLQTKETDKGTAIYEPESDYNVSHGYQGSTPTKEQRDLGQRAVDDLGRPFVRGGRLLGSRIPKAFAEQGGISLVGQSVSNPTELAQLAQVYRDPRFETFRIFLMRGDEVVYQTGITSRLPGVTKIVPGNGDGAAKFLQEIKAKMQELGSDGYYLLHNHPSGLPDASRADIEVTKNYAKSLPGFREHVIINERKFGVIRLDDFSASGVDDSTVVMDMKSPYNLYGEVQKNHPILAKTVGMPSDLAKLVKSVQISSGFAVLIGANRAGVTAVMEIPIGMLRNELKATAAIRQFARSSGSGRVFLAGVEQNDKNIDLADKAITYGVLTDVVFSNGISYSESSNSQEDGSYVLGRKGFRGSVVKEDRDEYDRGKRPATMGRGELIKYAREKGITVDMRQPTAKIRAAVESAAPRDGGTAAPPVPPKGGSSTPSVPGNRASWDAPEPGKMDALIYVLQDKLIDTKRVIQAIKNASGALTDAIDVYLQEELFHGRAAKSVNDFLDKELRPLLTDMSLRKVTMAELEEYLHARHAEERNEQIAKINPDMPDGGSGMDTGDARSYLAGIDPAKKRALDALAKRVDTMNRSTRQMLIEYGLESPDTIKAWEDTYKHYVPLQREDMEGGPGIGQGFSVRGSSSRRATGSDRAVVDIIANIAMQREKAIVRGEKNRVANAVIGLAKANPNPDFWKVDRPPMMKVVDERTGLVVERPDPLFKSRDNVIVARMPSKPTGAFIIEHAVIFNQRDERAMRMAQALKSLDAQDLGEVLGMAAKATRYFASINTQYNPIFGVVNLVRDTQGALLNLTATPLRGKQKEVLGHTISALRGIYIDSRATRNGEEARSAWADLWEEFQREGGQTGFRDMFRTSKDRAERIEREIGRVTEGKAKQLGRAVFDWLSDYNQAMENAVRLAAYKVGKESGLTNQRAASVAKNLTVNFNRKGQIGTQAGSLYAFFNASVQGTARMAETLTGPAGRKIIAGGLLLGSMQALLLAWAGFDDDEPPEFVRERNIIIPIGGKKYITIPMPLGMHILPNLSRIPTEYALGGFRDTHKHLVGLVNVFADAFNPIGNAGLSLQTIAPTIIDPIAALAENKDWTGKPIAREDMNKLAPTPGHTRAKDTASWPGKVVSKSLNWMTGGTNYTPGIFSPTPDQIDYLIGQATGGLGREAMKVEQTVASVITGEELPTYKIPLVGRLYGSSEGQGPQGNAFYENLKRINEHEMEVKGRMKASEKVDGYLRDHPEARLVGYGNAVEQKVSELRREKRRLVDKDGSRDRIKLIDQQITRTMKNFNEKVKEARQ